MLEDNILQAIENNKDGADLHLINKEYIKEYRGFIKDNKSSTFGLRLLRGAAVTLFGLLIIYVAAGSIVEAILSQGTLFFYSEIIDYAVEAAGLPMVFGSLALRNFYEKIFNKKRSEAVIRNDRLANGKFADRFSMIFFIITLTGSLLSFVYGCTQTESFYADYMKLHGEHMFQYEIHEYTDCDKLYLRKGIINPYGNYVERDSYLLVFKDGSYYDFDGEIENEEFLNNVYPILKDYTGDIQTIRCKEDIGLE